VKDESHVSKAVDSAGDEVVDEISAGCEENDVLDLGGLFIVLWVISVDVISGDNESEQAVDDGDNTVLEIVDLSLAEFGGEFEVVVDEEEEDGPSGESTGKENSFFFKGFDSHEP